MPKHEAHPDQFKNFEEHPVLKKLTVMDRLTLAAELAAEFNTIYVAACATGMLEAAKSVDVLSRGKSDLMTPDMRRALQAAAITLAQTAEHYLDESKKGADSNYYNGDSEGDF
jgi:hypothetical protein